MKKRLVVVLGLILLSLGASWVTPSQAAPPRSPNGLVINEVYAPNTTYNQQYFELFNTSANPINLTNYFIYNSGGSDQLNLVPPTPILAPGEHRVVGAAVLTGTIGSGLQPGADFLALVLRGATQDTVIDVVNWGSPNPNWPNYPIFQRYFWVGNAPTMPTSTNLSLQRFPDGFDSDQPTDWVQAIASPGQPPLPTPTPTGTATRTATPTGTPGAATPTPTPTVFCTDVYEGAPYFDTNPTTTGNILPLGSEQAHVICPSGDEDWMLINVIANKVYTLYTKDLGGGLDTILSVYTYPYDGTKIGENDDAPNCLCSSLDISFATAGTYLVRVRDNRRLGGLGWSYTVGFSAVPGPAPTSTPSFTPTPNPNAPTATPTPATCLDAYEPDGTPDSANLLLIGEIQQDHTFCPGGDADWYKFFGGRGKAYTLATSNLGIGVDTYMYLFDSDARTVIAQNDDISGPPPSGGPNDVVASAIQFFPVRDDFYYLMVKNKGDLGAPYMTYDISQRIQANVPPPAGSPTPIIAPVVTVTSPPLPTVPPPTEPPLPGDNTPTQVPLPTTPPGADETAAAVEATATAVAAVAAETGVAETAVAEATATAAVVGPPPTVEPPTPIVEPPTPTELPTVAPPGVPVTGGHGPAPPELISVPLVVYMDRNANNRFTGGEGIRGLHLVFLDEAGAALTEATTDRTGLAHVLLPRNSQAAISIPYLDWTGYVDAGPAGLTVRLPRVVLPTHIP